MKDGGNDQWKMQHLEEQFDNSCNSDNVCNCLLLNLMPRQQTGWNVLALTYHTNLKKIEKLINITNKIYFSAVNKVL